MSREEEITKQHLIESFALGSTPRTISRDLSMFAAMEASYAIKGEKGSDGAAPELVLSRFLQAFYLSLPPKEREATLLILSELLTPDGVDDYRLVLQRTRRGRPRRRSDAANLGHKAARIVEDKVRRGVKQESALMDAEAETGLSRAEILKWVAHVRASRARAAERRAREGRPEIVKMPD